MEILNVEDAVGEIHHEPVPMWSIQVSREEGTFVYFMPKDVFLIRAAEYDLDPDDLDTVIDVVMAEFMIDGREVNPADHLLAAPTIQHAREKHISLCAQKKLKHRISTRSTKDKSNPLDVIRQHHRDNPMHVYDYAAQQNRVFNTRRDFRANAR